MSKIILRSHAGTSKILIKNGLFGELPTFLEKEYHGARPVIILTQNLYKIQGARLKKMLPKALLLTIPPGEHGKTMETVLRLAERMIESGVNRQDVVIGFGGGMITDLAGFLASIYMRGLRFIAIPTTLLCMADAAIGGKTAIDFKAKNILGTTYMASHILVDPDFLKTLPPAEIRNGLGEIIKYAGILDTSLFKDFEKKKLDYKSIIQKSVRAKVKIVRQDPHEKGIRKILNFGHTFGHAIEAKSHFAVSHGEAVGIGMMIANRVAQRLGKQKPSEGDKIRRMLKKFGLAVNLPKGMKIQDLAPLILKDKKRIGDHINFVIMPRVGKVEIIKLRPEELIKLATP